VRPFREITKAACAITAANLIYLATIPAINSTVALSQPKLSSIKEIEQVINEEVDNLGLRDKKLNIILGNTQNGRCEAYKLGDNKYEIHLNPPLGYTRFVIKHELYHIADGHCEKQYLNTFKDQIGFALNLMYWYEPQAVIYSLTGLKP
jgi:hypothetical protein